MSQIDGTPDNRPQETTGRTVVGLFGQRAGAEAAIRDLQAAGFPQDRLGVAMQERVEQGDLLQGAGGEAAEGAAKGAVGEERRVFLDPAYPGPERRLVGA